MTTGEMIEWLRLNCKAEVSITINQHRVLYQTPREYMEDRDLIEVLTSDMERTDTIVDVQAYPDTPVGFYHAFSHDLDTALYEVVEAIKLERS